MSVATALIYRFGPVELDGAKGQVLRDGRTIGSISTEAAPITLILNWNPAAKNPR